MKRLGLLCLVALGAVTVTGPARAQKGTLDATTQGAILTVLDDEYRAGTLYQAVLKKFGADVKPFASIAVAEQQHQAALINLLTKYNLPVRANPYSLDAMLASVPDTLKKSCASGAEAELANIAFYDDLLPKVKAHPDVTRVFTALREATLYKHLPAFQRCASSVCDPGAQNRWQDNR